MSSVLLGLAFVSLLPQALGLDCWGCHSNESWADCESKLQSSFCTNDTSKNVCMTRKLVRTTAGKTETHHFKECGPLEYCNESLCNVQNGDTIVSCQANCCCHDNCNIGILVKDEVLSESGVHSMHGVCVIAPLVTALYSAMT